MQKVSIFFTFLRFFLAFNVNHCHAGTCGAGPDLICPQNAKKAQKTEPAGLFFRAESPQCDSSG
jgi:hypothetical protein